MIKMVHVGFLVWYGCTLRLASLSRQGFGRNSSPSCEYARSTGMPDIMGVFAVGGLDKTAVCFIVEHHAGARVLHVT
jgi:hypothetical protein